MKVREFIKVVSLYQEIRLFDGNDILFKGYRRHIDVEEWLDKDIHNVYTDGDDWLIIETE